MHTPGASSPLGRRIDCRVVMSGARPSRAGRGYSHVCSDMSSSTARAPVVPLSPVVRPCSGARLGGAWGDDGASRSARVSALHEVARGRHGFVDRASPASPIGSESHDLLFRATLRAHVVENRLLGGGCFSESNRSSSQVELIFPSHSDDAPLLPRVILAARQRTASGSARR